MNKKVQFSIVSRQRIVPFCSGKFDLQNRLAFPSIRYIIFLCMNTYYI